MERFRVQNAPSVNPKAALAGTSIGADLGSILSNFARSGAALVAPIERGAAAREGLNAGLAGGTERRSEITAAGRIFNEQLQAGFKARTLSQLREGLSKFAAEHPGNRLEDVSDFETKATELWGGMRSGIPADMQATFDLEFQERAGRAQAEIRANALANQRRLDIASINTGMLETATDAGVAARDGDIEGLGLTQAKYQGQLDELVGLGVISAAQADAEMAKLNKSVQAHAMHGGFLRAGSSPAALLSVIENQREIDPDVYNEAVGLMFADLRSRRSLEAAVEADQNRSDAAVREASADRLWSGLLDPEQPTPSIADIGAAVTDGLIEPADALRMRSFLDSQATERATDWNVVADIERNIASGIDQTDRIVAARNAGALDDTRTAALMTQNRQNLAAGSVPDPIKSTRDRIRDSLRVSGPMASLTENEGQFLAEAQLEFDSRVSRIPTTDPNRETEARRIADEIISRGRASRQGRGFRAPTIAPIGAVYAPGPAGEQLLDERATLDGILQSGLNEEQKRVEVERLLRWRALGLATNLEGAIQ